MLHPDLHTVQMEVVATFDLAVGKHHGLIHLLLAYWAWTLPFDQSHALALGTLYGGIPKIFIGCFRCQKAL